MNKTLLSIVLIQGILLVGSLVILYQTERKLQVVYDDHFALSNYVHAIHQGTTVQWTYWRKK